MELLSPHKMPGMQYRLRTLLIALGILPPVLAGAYFYSSLFWLLAVAIGTVLMCETVVQVFALVFDRTE